MRRLLARWLAVVAAVLLLALALGFAYLQRPASLASARLDAAGSASRAPVEFSAPASSASTSEPSKPSPSAQGAERGRQVYDAQNCWRCHSIAGSGNVRQPLDGVGSRLEREQIRTWIVAPQQMSRGVAKRPYDLPSDELEALVDYLVGLRAAGSNQGP